MIQAVQISLLFLYSFIGIFRVSDVPENQKTKDQGMGRLKAHTVHM